MRYQAFLASIIVLGLITTANATLFFSVDGTNPASSMNVRPNHTYEIFFVSNSACNNYWTYIEANLPVAADFGEPYINNNVWNIYPAAGGLAWITDYSIYSTFLDVELDAFDISGTLSSGKHFGIVLIISPDANTDGSDDFSIWNTVPNDQYYPIDNTFTFHIIPETTTLLLLGLGAIIVRRKS
jgi:hypothetical protein